MRICVLFSYFSLDKSCNLWYNGKFGTHRTCARRQIKMSQYPNWLHSPTHFREHSVALLSRPNVHDLWRVRFRNFLTCGFYFGGLLISFTPFLCFNYNMGLAVCQPLLLNFCDTSICQVFAKLVCGEQIRKCFHSWLYFSVFPTNRKAFEILFCVVACTIIVYS